MKFADESSWRLGWSIATAVLSGAMAGKLAAYVVEFRWQLRIAASARWEWANRRRDSDIAMEEAYSLLQAHLGRPEPVLRQLRRIRIRLLSSGLSLLWRVPVLILAAALSMTMAGSANPWVLDIAAILLSVTAVVVLATALAGRLLMGTLDALNTDLKPRAGFGLFVQAADGAQLRLVYYFAALVFMAVVSGAGASAAVANAHPGAFAGGGLRSSVHPTPDIDPIPYLYYSVVTIATVGYGDITPHSDLARLLTILHIASGPLLFSWLIAMFVQTSVQGVTASFADVSRPEEHVNTACVGHDAQTCLWRIRNPLPQDCSGRDAEAENHVL